MVRLTCDNSSVVEVILEIFNYEIPSRVSMNVTGKTKHTKQCSEAFSNCLRSHCLASKHEREATELINDNQEVFVFSFYKTLKIKTDLLPRNLQSSERNTQTCRCIVSVFFFCAGNGKIDERLKSVRIRFDSVLIDSVA